MSSTTIEEINTLTAAWSGAFDQPVQHALLCSFPWSKAQRAAIKEMDWSGVDWTAMVFGHDQTRTALVEQVRDVQQHRGVGVEAAARNLQSDLHANDLSEMWTQLFAVALPYAINHPLFPKNNHNPQVSLNPAMRSMQAAHSPLGLVALNVLSQFVHATTKSARAVHWRVLQIVAGFAYDWVTEMPKDENTPPPNTVLECCSTFLRHDCPPHAQTQKAWIHIALDLQERAQNGNAELPLLQYQLITDCLTHHLSHHPNALNDGIKKSSTRDALAALICHPSVKNGWTHPPIDLLADHLTPANRALLMRHVIQNKPKFFLGSNHWHPKSSSTAAQFFDRFEVVRHCHDYLHQYITDRHCWTKKLVDPQTRHNAAYHFNNQNLLGTTPYLTMLSQKVTPSNAPAVANEVILDVCLHALKFIQERIDQFTVEQCHTYLDVINEARQTNTNMLGTGHLTDLLEDLNPDLETRMLAVVQHAQLTQEVSHLAAPTARPRKI